MAFATLSVLEIVLGIDNIIFLSILVGRLPPARQKRARIIGLALAMLTRIALLFSIVWLTRLTQPWFTVAGQRISGRDLVLAGGGLFLLAKSVLEIHHTLEGAAQPSASARVFASFAADRGADRGHRHRVLARFGVHGRGPGAARPGAGHGGGDRDRRSLVMMWLSGPISAFVDTPSDREDAGARVPDPGRRGAGRPKALDFHIPKGYLYFAMAFSVLVEMINIRLRKLLDARRQERPHH